MSGQPVAWADRLRCEAATAPATTSTPAASPSRSVSSRARALVSLLPARATLPGCGTAAAIDVTSAASRAACARRSSARVPIAARRASTPSPVVALVGRMRTPRRPSSASSPRSDSTTRGTSAAGSRSTWLSTTIVTAPCRACVAMKSVCSTASAYFCGSTTHTSASTWPARRSAVARCAASTESKSGRSSRMSWPARASIGTSRTWRSRTSSQSSSADAPAGSQLTASGSDVVGRRTWLRAIGSPTSAFNRLDLPEPVAPNSPTTVWSDESARRPSARVSSASICASCASGSRPAPSECTSRSASSWVSSVIRARVRRASPSARPRR